MSFNSFGQMGMPGSYQQGYPPGAQGEPWPPYVEPPPQDEYGYGSISFAELSPYVIALAKTASEKEARGENLTKAEMAALRTWRIYQAASGEGQGGQPRPGAMTRPEEDVEVAPRQPKPWVIPTIAGSSLLTILIVGGIIYYVVQQRKRKAA